MNRFRILIVGAGAIGSVVGGFLSKAGHRVALLGRSVESSKPLPEHVAEMQKSGLRVSGIWGEHRIVPIDARCSREGLAAGDFDWILITVKSYDTRSAVASVQHLVDDNTLVCSYQNGLGNAKIIADILGWRRTVGARAIYGVRIPKPGNAEVTVIANPTALGVYDESTPNERVHELVHAMDAAGLPTVFTDEIETLLWSKVAYNCALNPMSALLGVPYGALLDTEDTRRIMREVVTELYVVGAKMSVRLRPDTPEEYIELLFTKLIPPTAAHFASMYEDIVHGKRTEIDALNGAICRYGDDLNIPCPTNTLLTRLIRAREQLSNASRTIMKD